MRPKLLKAGTTLWIRYIHKRRGIKTLHCRIERVGEERGNVLVRSPNGGSMDYTNKQFWCVAGRADAEDLYELTVRALSGDWKTVPVGHKFKEAVRRAYLTAMQPHVREVTITREQRQGISYCVAELAAHDGRCWMGKTGTLGSVMWKGQPPAPESGAVEITGKFELAPPSYVI